MVSSRNNSLAQRRLLTWCFLRNNHFLTERKPAFLTAPVQLKEAAVLLFALPLLYGEVLSMPLLMPLLLLLLLIFSSSSDTAVVKDMRSSSEICKKPETEASSSLILGDGPTLRKESTFPQPNLTGKPWRKVLLSLWCIFLADSSPPIQRSHFSHLIKKLLFALKKKISQKDFPLFHAPYEPVYVS